MPLQFLKQPVTPAHWSKDFVEHLRTIHLALIATAVALVVVALTTKPYSTAAAGNEIRQIQDLRNHWSPEFVRNLPDETHHEIKMFQRTADYAIGRSKQGRVLQQFIKPSVKKLYVKVGLTDVSKPEFYLVNLPDEYWTQDFRLDYAHPLSCSVKEIPDTMSGFRQWWNQLRKATCNVYFPTSVMFGEIERMGSSSSAPYMMGHGPRETLEVFNSEPFLKRGLKPKGEATLELVPGPEDVLFYNANLLDGTNLQVFPDTWSRTDVNTQLLASYLALNDGTFEQLFRDLNDYSQSTGIQSLKVLEDALSKSDSSDLPVFEAFGIKFPADLATLGGTIALLSVQLYFFTYLRKLRGSLKKDDPGWDVPWIGMDSSGLARLIFLFTVVLFPIFSLSLLSEKAAFRLTRGYWEYAEHPFKLASIWGWHWSVQLKLAGLFIAIISTTFLGVRSWNCRPQLISVSSPNSISTPDSVATKPEA